MIKRLEPYPDKRSPGLQWMYFPVHEKRQAAGIITARDALLNRLSTSLQQPFIIRPFFQFSVTVWLTITQSHNTVAKYILYNQNNTFFTLEKKNFVKKKKKQIIKHIKLK